MKNSTTISIAVVLLLIVAIGAYALFGQSQNRPASEEMIEKTDKMMENDGEMEKTDTVMEESRAYLPFTPEVLATSANTRRVLFFYANWCPTCRPADQSFTNNIDQIPADVTLIRVNYNDTDIDQDEEALAEKYGVTYQHTFVQIDEDGNEVTKWNGGAINELLSNVQ